MSIRKEKEAKELEEAEVWIESMRKAKEAEELEESELPDDPDAPVGKHRK